MSQRVTNAGFEVRGTQYDCMLEYVIRNVYPVRRGIMKHLPPMYMSLLLQIMGIKPLALERIACADMVRVTSRDES